MTIVLSEPCSLENELTRLDLLLDAARRAYGYALVHSESVAESDPAAVVIDLQRALQLYGIEV